MMVKRTRWFKVLVKDFKLLKFFFILFTAYLLYGELKLFVIEKPTLTSLEKIDLSAEHFPEILICPRHGYDEEMLERHGYATSFHYSTGVPVDDNRTDLIFRGWRGKTLEQNYSVRDVMDAISVMKNASHCPTVTALFDIEGKYREEELETFLTRQIYPNGRCCRAKQPELAKKYPLYEISFSFEDALMILEEQLGLNAMIKGGIEDLGLENSTRKSRIKDQGKTDEEQSPASFNMFLYDRRYFSNLRQSLFELEGDRLVSGGRGWSQGFDKYREGAEKKLITMEFLIHPVQRSIQTFKTSMMEIPS